MKKEFLVGTLTATLCLGGIGMMTSCTNEDPVNNETNNEGNTGSGNSAYVIAATVDDASYLVTASSLDEGEISLDNSKEVIDATYWVYKDQKMVFALVYNKGGSGTGASYYLDGQGDIQKNMIIPTTASRPMEPGERMWSPFQPVTARPPMRTET